MTDEPTIETQSRSVEDILVQDCTRQVDTIARRLEELAKDLRRQAGRFANPAIRGGAVGVAADVANDYVQRTGQVGTYLHTLITGAHDLDRERSKP